MDWSWLPTKAAILNGMKALPLTIVLTVLIWMYAESQFISTEEAGMGGAQLVLPSVPLWVSAPPGVLADYRVEPRVINVQITVGGTDAKIRALKTALDAGKDMGIHGSLGVTDDPVTQPETEASGEIEYVLPEGIVLRDGPQQGEYVLHRRAALKGAETQTGH